MVHLDVLARRDVALAERHPLLDHVGERLHLLGCDAAEGQLHPYHLDVGLALAVHAQPQPEADELLLGRRAAEELLGLVVEVVELPLEHRDDVARYVLDDLRVVERALPAPTFGLYRDRFHDWVLRGFESGERQKYQNAGGIRVISGAPTRSSPPASTPAGSRRSRAQ